MWLSANSPATIATGVPSSITVDPSGMFVYVTDVSNSSVYMYAINQSTGVLTATTPSTVAAGSYAGSIKVDATGKFAYVANYQDNNVEMYSLNRTTGVLSALSPSTIAAGSSPNSVAVDPTGQFVLALSLDEALTAFIKSATTGLLNSAGNVTAGNGFPNFVAVDPTGKFAYFTMEGGGSNQAVPSILMYSINPSTGVLTPTSPATVSAGTYPTSIAFYRCGRLALPIQL